MKLIDQLKARWILFIAWLMNQSQRTVKAVSILRVLVMGSLILLVVVYSTIYFAGGFLYYGGYPQNATLYTQFNAIRINPSTGAGSIAGSYNTLQQRSGQQANNFTNSSLNVGLVSTIVTAASYFTTVGSLLNGIIVFAGTPFIYALHLPLQYVEVVGSLMIVAVIILAILTIWSLVY